MPSRLPENVKVLRGSRAKRRDYPKPAPQRPKEPKWHAILGDRAAARDARAWWAAVVPALDAAGLLSALDATVVVECAICHARIRQCERELAGHLLVPGPRGTMVRNPISMTLSSYRQSLKTYIRELGLSPSSRQSLDVPKVEGDANILEQLIAEAEADRAAMRRCEAATK